jgi:hypothetical protein
MYKVRPVGAGAGLAVGDGMAVGVGVDGAVTVTLCSTEEFKTLPSPTVSPTTYVPGDA